MNKKLLTLIVTLLVALCTVSAQSDTLNASRPEAVSLESYDQSWLDTKGVVVLKNNTSEHLDNVAFRLTYYDMEGHQLDYAEFAMEVDINPGMARQYSIDAFAHDRRYSYYKSDVGYDNKEFKVEYSLLDYNVEDLDEKYGDANGSASDSVWPAIFAVPLVGFVLFLVFGIYILVGIMAKHRNRSVILWILVSIFLSPIAAIILLLCLGKDENGQNY